MTEMISFSIRIVNADGDPVSGQDVYVSAAGVLGGPAQSQYTDEDGWATFEFICYTFYGVAHVAGEKYDIEMSDGETMSISI